jgi:hypothetical protein
MTFNSASFAPGSDALTDALQLIGAENLVPVHFAADRSYSSCRIQLQITILDWLARVGIASVPGNGAPAIDDIIGKDAHGRTRN